MLPCHSVVRRISQPPPSEETLSLRPVQHDGHFEQESPFHVALKTWLTGHPPKAKNRVLLTTYYGLPFF